MLAIQEMQYFDNFSFHITLNKNVQIILLSMIYNKERTRNKALFGVLLTQQFERMSALNIKFDIIQ